MTVDQILMLADRGFTAQQITAFAQMQQTATPAPAVPAAPEVPAVPAAPAAPAAPAVPAVPAAPAVDPLAAMQQQMQQLTQTILNNSVANSQQPPMQTADDVLYAVLIDPDNTK